MLRLTAPQAMPGQAGHEYVVLALSKSFEVAIEMAEMEPAVSARIRSKLEISQHR